MSCTLKYGATQILDLITSSNQLYAVEMVMDWKKMKFVLTLIITSEYILSQKRFNRFWFQDYHQRKMCSMLFKPEKDFFAVIKSKEPKVEKYPLRRIFIMRDYLYREFHLEVQGSHPNANSIFVFRILISGSH